VLAAFSDPKAPFYIWTADRANLPVVEAIRDNGYEVRAHIIWNKNQAQYGALTAQYKAKHETGFYVFKKGQSPYWYGPTNEVTVWDVSRAASNDFHPTQKPVELAERAINNSSQTDDTVLDLFGGSGSTLIACEQTNRQCRMMELDPIYCDVIVRRWENFTGQTATLALHEAVA
jgi:site-specific DNA-methyltransferase (adenine-specific)